MGQVYFYHLTRSDAASTAATLLGKCLGAGWRVALRGGDPERLRWLDEKLWLGASEGFLPHGLEGGAHDARQPVLLTTQGGAPANGAQAVMAVDGAGVDPGEVAALERVMVIFDGGDAESVGRARVQWKALTDAGCAARYWSEEGGAWAEKASKNL